MFFRFSYTLHGYTYMYIQGSITYYNVRVRNLLKPGLDMIESKLLSVYDRLRTPLGME